MPFDGTNTRGAKAVYVLDRMLEMFDGGKYWLCGAWNLPDGDGHKHRCLLSALRSIRRIEGIFGDNTGRYIGNAIYEDCGWRGIVSFNDLMDQNWRRIERTLHRARELAAQDIG
jgi:hypothetical protein